MGRPGGRDGFVGDDLDRIMAVMQGAFDPEYGEAWTRRQVGDALLLGNTRYGLVAPDGSAPADAADETAGFFLSRRVLDEEELLLFAIAPEYRRRGLGRILLARNIAEARAAGVSRIFLEMRDGNTAESLYKSAGFVRIGVRPAYYRTASAGRLDAVTQHLVLV